MNRSRRPTRGAARSPGRPSSGDEAVPRRRRRASGRPRRRRGSGARGGAGRGSTRFRCGGAGARTRARASPSRGSDRARSRTAGRSAAATWRAPARARDQLGEPRLADLVARVRGDAGGGAQRRAHRQVRGLRSVRARLDADDVEPLGLVERGLDQPRLADPRLADELDDPPPACPGDGSASRSVPTSRSRPTSGASAAGAARATPRAPPTVAAFTG